MPAGGELHYWVIFSHNPAGMRCERRFAEKSNRRQHPGDNNTESERIGMQSRKACPTAEGVLHEVPAPAVGVRAG